MSTANYTFDDTKIELIAPGKARLKVPVTSGTIMPAEIMSAASLTSISETVVKSGADDIKYHFKRNGSFVYHNGSAWVSSDQSFSQSNTVAEINAAASTLLSSNSTLQIQAVLSGSGATSPELDSLSVTYVSGPVFATTDPDECIVYCYLRDILDDDLSVSTHAPKLLAVNDESFVNNGIVVARFTKEASFALTPEGLMAQLSVIRTANSNKKIRFMITYEPTGDAQKLETIRFKPSVIPNSASADLTSIASIDSTQVI